jgi:multiple sugar transport system substrate-binding protein
MVHTLKGALALGTALMLATSAMAQDKRVVTWNADYDPIPLAAAEA